MWNTSKLGSGDKLSEGLAQNVASFPKITTVINPLPTSKTNPTNFGSREITEICS